MTRLILTACFVLLSAVSGYAQSTQIWPELSVFSKVNDSMRFYLVATTVKENNESTEGEFGPNIDFYLSPLRHATHLGRLTLDESKKRYVLLRAGYRYLNSFGGDPNEHRVVIEGTTRFPLQDGLLVSLRNRVDLRSIDAERSWRFRARLSVEKELAVGRVAVTPYIRGELYYDSRFHDWSRSELIGGAAVPLNRRIELEGYFNYQNDTGGDVNRQVYAVGTVLNLYF